MQSRFVRAKQLRASNGTMLIMGDCCPVQLKLSRFLPLREARESNWCRTGKVGAVVLRVRRGVKSTVSVSLQLDGALTSSTRLERAGNDRQAVCGARTLWKRARARRRQAANRICAPVPGGADGVTTVGRRAHCRA